MIPPTRHIVALSARRGEDRFWNRLLPELAKHPQILDARVTVAPHPIPGPIGRRGRLWPRLLAPLDFQAERVHRLLCRAPYLGARPEDDPEIVLLADRRGCRLIQLYLLRCLDRDGDTRNLHRIRKVLLFRPSRQGQIRLLLAVGLLALFGGFAVEILRQVEPSFSFGWIVSLLGAVVTLTTTLIGIATSETALQVLGLQGTWLDRGDLERQFDRKIRSGAKTRPGTWPIPTREIHSLSLGDAGSDDVEMVAEAILSSVGHPYLYDVEHEEINLSVSPITEQELPPEIRRRLPTNNVAVRRRSVRFARWDATEPDPDLPPWEMRYGTYGGYVVADHLPPDNLWKPEERSAYEYTHQHFVYRFRPRSGVTYHQNLTIYGGFDEGNRDLHVHFRADAYIRRYIMKLDLRGYLQRGWSVAPPRAWFFPGGLLETNPPERNLATGDCDCIKSDRKLEDGRPLEAREIEAGYFEWTVGGLRDGGVLGLRFEVAPAVQQEPGAA